MRAGSAASGGGVAAPPEPGMGRAPKREFIAFIVRPSLGQGADTFRFPRPCTDNGTEADRGVTTASGIHAVPFTAEVIRITGLVPDAMVDAWEQVSLSDLSSEGPQSPPKDASLPT